MYNKSHVIPKKNNWLQTPAAYSSWLTTNFEKNIAMEARDLCHGPFDDRFGHIHLSGKLQLGNFSSKKNKRRS